MRICEAKFGDARPLRGRRVSVASRCTTAGGMPNTAPRWIDPRPDFRSGVSLARGGLPRSPTSGREAYVEG